jgi:hypothetical protein
VRPPYIMFLHSGRFLEGSYDIGWLITSDEVSSDKFILVWGNSKNKETTDKLAKNIIEEDGERQIIRYNKKLSTMDRNSGVITLTSEVLEDILHGTDTEILYEPVKG